MQDFSAAERYNSFNVNSFVNFDCSFKISMSCNSRVSTLPTLQVSERHFENPSKMKFHSECVTSGAMLECLAIVATKGCSAVTKILFFDGDFKSLAKKQVTQVFHTDLSVHSVASTSYLHE